MKKVILAFTMVVLFTACNNTTTQPVLEEETKLEVNDSLQSEELILEQENTQVEINE